jgi:hypothetical protein
MVMPFAFDEGWAVVVFVRLGDCIDGKARAVRSCIRGNVPCVDIVVFDQVHSKAGLIHMNGDTAGGR